MKMMDIYNFLFFKNKFLVLNIMIKESLNNVVQGRSPPLLPSLSLCLGRGPVALQAFWPLKKGTRTFNFQLNAPSLDLQGPLFQCDHPEKRKKNKHP